MPIRLTSFHNGLIAVIRIIMHHTCNVKVTLAVHMGTATLRVYVSLTGTPSLLQNSKITIGYLHKVTLMEFAEGLRKRSAQSLMALLTKLHRPYRYLWRY